MQFIFATLCLHWQALFHFWVYRFTHPPSDGRVLLMSDAVLYIGRTLGGLWQVGALLLGSMKRTWLNAAYGWIARNRHRFFESPDKICPLVSAAFRSRFTDQIGLKR